jgi:hypothetical protein
MTTHPLLFNVLLAAGLFGGLVVCLEGFFRIGLRARARGVELSDQHSTIQGSILGLQALLLGFSFALAAGRFSDRSQLIVQEANAIGTAALRCDLMVPARRDEARELLRQYTEQRIAFFDARETDARAKAVEASERLQGRVWGIVAAAAKAMPEFSEVLLPPVNEMIDLHGSRVAAGRRHMPGVLLGLLIVCSLVSMAAVGYGCGVAGRRNAVMTTALALLFAATLWAIIDMDHPRRGLIRVSQQPMLDLRESLKASVPAAP